MNKIGRMLVVVFALMIQVIISILYGFSGISVPAWGCFLTWCVCAVIVYRFVGVPKVV